MALGAKRRARKAAADSERRYIVSSVAVLSTGKGALQMELDRGVAMGYTLAHVVGMERANVLVVWENPDYLQDEEGPSQ